MGTSGNRDCQRASRSALKDFTDDALTISAGNQLGGSKKILDSKQHSSLIWSSWASITFPDRLRYGFRAYRVVKSSSTPSTPHRARFNCNHESNHDLKKTNPLAQVSRIFFPVQMTGKLS